MKATTISKLSEYVGEEVTINGWVYSIRNIGKIWFVILRDGTGLLQGVVVKGEATDITFKMEQALNKEDSISLKGFIKKEPRSVGGYEMGVRDFAGGLVVHLTAGITALVIAFFLGPRDGFPNSVQPPHNPGLTMMGACMLWVGWFGFNGGSALAANGDAGMAILVTHISAATATIVWIIIEKVKFGKSSLVGAVTGCIAGLASITPASGSVGPMGGLIIGLIAGGVCYYMVNIVKETFNIDDSLDVFAVHGVGGLTGTILVTFLALPTFGGLGLAEGITASHQLWVQFVGAAATAAWAITVSVCIIWMVRLVTPMRVSEEDETEGLDITSHGERGYNL